MARPDPPAQQRAPLPHPAEPDAPPRDVEVRVPAAPPAVVTMRTVAADLASRAEFTLDAVADLRMAVDEMCTGLIALARPGTRMTCTFVLEEERITVTATVSTAGPRRLPTDSLGWHVLTVLADDVRMLGAAPGHGAGDGDPHRLALRLSVGRVGTMLP